MASFQIRSMMSCGIKELSNISSLATPEDVVKATAVKVAEFNDCYVHNPAFLLFSGVVSQRKRVYSSHLHADRSDNYGQALADYILAEDLGTVSVSQAAINHNGNTLRVWLWAPKWEKLKKMWEAAQAAQQPTTQPQHATIQPTPGTINTEVQYVYRTQNHGGNSAGATGSPLIQGNSADSL